MKATREDAKQALKTLTAAGHKAYLAGGCVRDMLLGLEPNDYDVTTSATPEEVAQLFPHSIPVGAAFGVMKVVFGDNRELDIATFRIDGKYSDNRRPDSVEYTRTPEEDVKRRDFTINAMLMDVDDQVIDFVGGQEDLNKRIVRTVGDPYDRFKEDALRMMRAIRFATRFNFAMDASTWEAISVRAMDIKHISKERVTDELSKTFSHGNCHTSYLLLRSSYLWRHWFGNQPSGSESWDSLLGLMRVEPNRPFILPLAIILNDTWPSAREQSLAKLTLTNEQKAGFQSLLDHAKKMKCFLREPLSTQRRMMNWEDKALVFNFLYCQVDDPSWQYSLQAGETVGTVIQRMAEVDNMGWPDAIINGNDLLEAGYVQHKVFSDILEHIRTEQLEQRIFTKEAAMEEILRAFPAAPRKLGDGTILDRMSRRTLVAQCKCGRIMSFTVEYNEKGTPRWETVADKQNMCTLRPSDVFACCTHCYGRRKKTKFVEAKL